MCNFKHARSKPIPETGFGWKVFTKLPDGELGRVFNYGHYLQDPCKGVSWHNSLNYKGVGFCFCPTRAEARRLLYDLKNAEGLWGEYSNCVIRKIEYKGGIEKHQENKILDGYEYETALATWFRVIPGR
jgi:hypothetical protein